MAARCSRSSALKLQHPNSHWHASRCWVSSRAMARKSSANSESTHGFNDIIGIVLMGFALLLLVSLLSYHPRDVSANGLPTNPSVRNWIGPFGAWMAYYWFLIVGAAAY